MQYSHQIEFQNSSWIKRGWYYMRTKKGISEWTLSKIILKKDILVGFAESRGKVRLRVEGICIFMR